MKVYQRDKDDYYVGAFDSPVLPHRCVTVMPEITPGYIPRWNGEKWEQVENHRGKKGWLNGVEAEIKDFGPLPVGWSDTEPPPTEEELRKREIERIEAALLEIDRKSIRALRDDTEEDRAWLDKRKAEAAKLRDELKALEPAKPE